MRTLRTDQAETIERIRDAARRGVRRIMLQGPCGVGKTVLASGIVDSARDKGKRVLFMVPAVSLVDQTYQSFYGHGIRDIGVIQADHVLTDWSKPVQVASVQTLIKRGELPEADVVIMDEAHKWFTVYEQWLTNPAWENVPVIGMSATPWGPVLGNYFRELIIAGSIPGMIDLGILSPYRVYTPAHPDLQGVRTTGDDYNQGDLGDAMNRSKLVADIVESWAALGENRPTICFAVDRAHASHIAQRFEQAGVPSGYMDCDTPVHERNHLHQKVRDGEVKVVCNVDVMGMGVDWPEISCIVYARPTKSDMRFVQNIGRGLRSSPDTGKKDCIILDHSDTHLRLGFVSDVEASHKDLRVGREKVKPVPRVLLPKECPNCAFLKPPRAAECPACGHKCEQHVRQIAKEKAGQLAEFKGAKRDSAASKFPDKVMTYRMLLGYFLERGKNPGAAFHKYRALYGVQPNFSTRTLTAVSPTAALCSWVRSQNIAWANSKNRESNGERRPAMNMKAPLTERENELVDRVRQQYVGETLCTEDDPAELGRM